METDGITSPRLSWWRFFSRRARSSGISQGRCRSSSTNVQISPSSAVMNLLDSPDAVHASDGSHVQSVRLTMPPAKDLMMGTILALSIVINIWLIYEYRDFRTQEWLKNNDLTFFKTNEYADLNAKVLSQESLINSYGLRQACKEK